MKKATIAEQIDLIINPGTSEKAELTDDDKSFIEEFNSQIADLPIEEKELLTRNVIRKSGRCGFTNSGTYDYLVNTDRNYRYRVTVETRWRSGGDSGRSERVYIMVAGSRKNLGCTDSGYIPVTFYTRTVVGEEKL